MKPRFENARRPLIQALEGRTLLSGMFGNSLVALSISDAAIYEGNNGNSNMVFRVDLNAPSYFPLSVQYQTIDGTAKAGTDYVSTEGILYFNVGATSNTIAVPIIGNTRMDGNRAFTVKLFNSFTVSINRDVATGTIVDDDLPAVGVKAVQPAASPVGPVNGTVRFVRTAGTTGDLKVLYSVSGTAKAGTDYAKLPGSAIIKAGRTYVDVAVKPIAKAAKPGSKTVIITLSSSSAYVLGSARKATVTISSKETAPPSASLSSNPGVSAPSTQPYRFTSVFNDNVAINASSVVTGNIRVTGPNEYSQLATLVSRKTSADGKSVTAVYSIPAPGGSWDASDNGVYTILILPNQIKDTAGNALVAGGLGTFAVAVS